MSQQQQEQAPCLVCGAPSCPLCQSCHEEDCPASTDILCFQNDAPSDNLTDAEADSQTLASAGMGTNEDYGYYGEDD